MYIDDVLKEKYANDKQKLGERFFIAHILGLGVEQDSGPFALARPGPARLSWPSGGHNLPCALACAYADWETSRESPVQRPPRHTAPSQPSAWQSSNPLEIDPCQGRIAFLTRPTDGNTLQSALEPF